MCVKAEGVNVADDVISWVEKCGARQEGESVGGRKIYNRG